MDYKEKLRLAEEALASGSYDKETIEYIFPELRESEDEKTRKAILELVKQSSAILSPMNQKSMIAWLEKQGEKTIPKNIDDAAFQYIDTCAVDGRVTHDNINEPYWNNHSMMNAYKAGWLEKQDEQPSWSEEDEKFVVDTMNFLYRAKNQYAQTARLEECIDWLKSIKPNHWKPSEEQMKALNAINNIGELSYVEQADLLIKLYNDLEKL